VGLGLSAQRRLRSPRRECPGHINGVKVRPRVRTVEATEDAIDFYPWPHNTMIAWVDDDAGHEGYANGAFPEDVYA
jgi:hypothetical protein